VPVRWARKGVEVERSDATETTLSGGLRHGENPCKNHSKLSCLNALRAARRIAAEARLTV
jgi:hypothetical protein